MSLSLKTNVGREKTETTLLERHFTSHVDECNGCNRTSVAAAWANNPLGDVVHAGSRTAA
jgi:hypothetical protein